MIEERLIGHFSLDYSAGVREYVFYRKWNFVSRIIVLCNFGQMLHSRFCIAYVMGMTRVLEDF